MAISVAPTNRAPRSARRYARFSPGPVSHGSSRPARERILKGYAAGIASRTTGRAASNGTTVARGSSLITGWPSAPSTTATTVSVVGRAHRPRPASPPWLGRRSAGQPAGLGAHRAVGRPSSGDLGLHGGDEVAFDLPPVLVGHVPAPVRRAGHDLAGEAALGEQVPPDPADLVGLAVDERVPGQAGRQVAERVSQQLPSSVAGAVEPLDVESSGQAAPARGRGRRRGAGRRQGPRRGSPPARRRSPAGPTRHRSSGASRPRGRGGSRRWVPRGRAGRPAGRPTPRPGDTDLPVHHEVERQLLGRWVPRPDGVATTRGQAPGVRFADLGRVERRGRTGAGGRERQVDVGVGGRGIAKSRKPSPPRTTGTRLGVSRCVDITCACIRTSSSQLRLA